MSVSVMEYHLCTASPSGERNAVFGFGGDYGNEDWINEGQDNPAPITDTSDDDDFDSQAKRGTVWDDWN